MDNSDGVPGLEEPELRGRAPGGGGRGGGQERRGISSGDGSSAPSKCTATLPL